MKENLSKLKPLLGKKLLFAGIGSLLKSDDSAGVYITERIIKSEFVDVIIVENSIEKFVGKINSMGAEALILVDCTDFREKPGYYDFLPVDRIKDFTLHTHNVSLRRISEFFNMEVYVLGIQPLNLRFGEELSPVILEASNEVIEELNHILQVS